VPSEERRSLLYRCKNFCCAIVRVNPYAVCSIATDITELKARGGIASDYGNAKRELFAQQARQPRLGEKRTRHFAKCLEATRLGARNWMNFLAK